MITDGIFIKCEQDLSVRTHKLTGDICINAIFNINIKDYNGYT